MKELYVSPDVEIVSFLAMQAIADTDQSQGSQDGDFGGNEWYPDENDPIN